MAIKGSKTADGKVDIIMCFFNLEFLRKTFCYSIIYTNISFKETLSRKKNGFGFIYCYGFTNGLFRIDEEKR